MNYTELRHAGITAGFAHAAQAEIDREAPRLTPQAEEIPDGLDDEDRKTFVNAWDEGVGSYVQNASLAASRPYRFPH